MSGAWGTPEFVSWDLGVRRRASGLSSSSVSVSDADSLPSSSALKTVQDSDAAMH